MPAPHAFYSKMLAERTASRNVFVLFYFILFYFSPTVTPRDSSTGSVNETQSTRLNPR
jgi:hypothetical protein